MDISNISPPATSFAVSEQKISKDVASPRADIKDTANDKKAATQSFPASKVDDLNRKLDAAGSEISFSVDKDTDAQIVKVIDKSTKEVIRQIPSKEMLAISKSIEEALNNGAKQQGILLNKIA